MAGILFRGLYGPKPLPKRLRNPEAAQRWGERFGSRWKKERDALSLKYDALGGKAELPALTEGYIRRKISLGSGLSGLVKKEWEKKTREVFREIAGIRKEPLYSLAMIPYEVLKQERRAKAMKKAADRAAISLFPSGESYARALKTLERDEKRLEEYSEILVKYRPMIFDRGARDEIARMAGAKTVSPARLLKDLDSIKKHIEAAKTCIGQARNAIKIRREMAEQSMRYIPH